MSVRYEMSVALMGGDSTPLRRLRSGSARRVGVRAFHDGLDKATKGR